MSYLLLGVTLWTALTFQLFMDENRDGLRQANEAGSAGVEYTVTWVNGDLSVVNVGTSMEDGSIVAEGEGTVTLQAGCAWYEATMDEVVGQGTIELPCVWHVYLTMVGR